MPHSEKFNARRREKYREARRLGLPRRAAGHITSDATEARQVALFPDLKPQHGVRVEHRLAGSPYYVAPKTPNAIAAGRPSIRGSEYYYHLEGRVELLGPDGTVEKTEGFQRLRVSDVPLSREELRETVFRLTEDYPRTNTQRIRLLYWNLSSVDRFVPAESQGS